MYERCVRSVVSRLRAYPSDARLSGTDSGLAGVWEEIVVQVRGGEGPFFDAYRMAMSCEAAVVLESLSVDERLLLWLWSEHWVRFDDHDGVPSDGMVLDDLTEELTARVLSAADEWPLSEDVERHYLYPGDDEPE